MSRWIKKVTASLGLVIAFVLCAVVWSFAANISGAISYSGSQTGTVYVGAWTTSAFTGVPAFTTTATVSTTINYTITGVTDGTYYIKSFVDVNANMTADNTEASGNAGGLSPIGVGVAGADVATIDFTMSDPSGGNQSSSTGKPFTIKIAVGADATHPVAGATVEIWDTKGDWMPENDVLLGSVTSGATYSSESATRYTSQGQQTLTMYYNATIDSTVAAILANPTYDSTGNARFSIAVKANGKITEKRDVSLSQYSNSTQYTYDFWGGWDPATFTWLNKSFVNLSDSPVVTVSGLKTIIGTTEYLAGGTIPEIKPGANDQNQNGAEISFNYKITGTTNEWEMGGIAKVCIDTNGNGIYDPFDHSKFFWDTNGGPYYSSAATWNWSYFNGLTDAEKKPYKLTQQQFDAQRAGKDWSMDSWINGYDVKNAGSAGLNFKMRWDGRDNNWNPVPKGTYAIQVKVYNPHYDENDPTVNLAYGPNTDLKIKIIGSSIAGTVKDDTENPVAGVRVNAGSPPPGGWGAAITKADGTYVISGLTSGNYHLNVEGGSSGFPNADYPTEIVLGTNDDVIGKDFTLERGGSVTGTITIPAPGFKKYKNPWSWSNDPNDPGYWMTNGWLQIEAWSPGSPQHGWTGVNVEDDGNDNIDQTVSYTLNLPPGTYNLKAQMEGFASQLGTSISVTKGQATTANLTLAKAGSISGTVNLPAGTSNTTGVFVDVSAESTDGKSFGWGGTMVAAGATSSPYIIRGLTAGTYNIRFNCWGRFKPGKTPDVAVAAGADVTGKDYTFEAGSKIAGKIVISGSTLNVMTSSGDSMGGSGGKMAKYKIEPSTGTLPGGGTEGGNLGQSNTFTLWINAWSPQTGYGTGTQVTITKQAASQEVAYEITGLEEGKSYQLDCFLFGFELKDRPIVYSAPNTTANISLEPYAGSVTGKVSGTNLKLANVRVIAREPWWDMWRAPIIATPDATGTYTLTGLGTGEYIVTCNEYSAAPSTSTPFGAPSGNFGMQTERIPVANGETLTGVDFTLSAGATIHGEITLSATNPPLKSDGTAITIADLEGKGMSASPVKMQWMGYQAAFKAQVRVVDGKAVYRLQGLGDDIYAVEPPVRGYNATTLGAFSFGQQQADVAGAKQTVAVKSGDIKPLNFELSNGYTISGSIQRPSTNGVKGDGEDHFFVSLQKAGGGWDELGGTSVDFMDTTDWQWLPQSERTDNTTKRSLSFTLKHIPNGSYVLRIFPWKNAYKEETKEVTIASADANIGSINVSQGATIIGKLVDGETGMAVTDDNGIFVQCEARPWIEGSWRSSNQAFEEDWKQQSSSTETDTTKFWEKKAGQKTGVFRIKNLPAGNYMVNILSNAKAEGQGFSNSTSNKTYINKTIAGIVVPDSTDEVDIGTLKLKGGVTISGAVTDSSNNKLANVLMAAVPASTRKEVAATVTKTDKDGKYQLEGIDPLVGFWNVTAAARPRDGWREGIKVKYGEQTKFAISPLSTDVNFVLEGADASIGGQVLKLANKDLALPFSGEEMPVAMLLLQNQSWSYPDPMGGVEDITTPDGRFTIHGVVPTKLKPNGAKENLYTLKVFSKGAATYIKKDIEVTKGANSIGNLQLIEGGKVYGTIKDSTGKNISSSLYEMPLVSTADFSNMVFGTFTTNAASKEIERYDIDGLTPGTDYYVVLVAQEGADIYIDTTTVKASAATDNLARNITWVNKPPYFMAAAVKNETGNFLFGVWATESITEAEPKYVVSITTNPANSSAQPDVTAKGTLSQLEMSLDKQELSGVFTPDVSDLAFTLKVQGHDVTGLAGGGNYNFATTVDAYNVQIINPLMGGKVTASGAGATSSSDSTALTLPPGAVSDPTDPTASISAEVSKVQEVGATAMSFNGVIKKVAVPVKNYPKAFQAVVTNPKANLLIDENGKIIRSGVSQSDKVSSYYDFKIGSAQVSTGKNIKVSLSYDSTKVTDTDLIDVYYLSDNGWVRENNGRTVDTTNKTISVDVNHTSLFAVYKSLGGAAAPSGIPDSYTVYSYPNPYKKKEATNPLTIKVGIPAGSSRDVKIKIFNIVGELVREISASSQAPGWHDINWDCKNDGGVEIASGVYLAQVEAGGEEKIVKIAVLK